ncbi:Zinc finger protein-likeGfi-1b [Orchesella cincta]|uniref:Zinc finger protein-likeGfi-1b n=1 Tax=Orchesella cincta TaxID=48709 RepID=A0A1D2MKM0_ORCCI|nr:Zinc finger protein-likeGfi-1b [Orchesella cincta]
MRGRICLVCLRKTDEETSTSEESGIPLLTKFLKFVENYLHISQVPKAEQLLVMSGGDGKAAFCEKCDLSVITPICQVYSQLLATQLRLSWELEQLEKLLINSESSTKLDSLANQEGIVNNNQLNNFICSLIEKCQLKRKEMSPQVVVQKLILIPTALEESPNQDQSKVKLEMEPLFENYHDHDGFDDVQMDIEVEHTTIKIEIVHESQPTDDTEEGAVVPTCDPALPPPVKKPDEGTPGIKKFTCPKCLKIFPTRESLMCHGYRVHTHRKFRCDQCESCFKTKAHLKKHVSCVHKSRTCKQCGIVCKNFKVFKMHLMKSHSDCPKCGRSFKHKRNIKKHLPICSGVKWSNVKSPNKKATVIIHKTIPCNICSESFSTRLELENHVAAFHAQKVELSFDNIKKMFLEQKLKKK